MELEKSLTKALVGIKTPISFAAFALLLIYFISSLFLSQYTDWSGNQLIALAGGVLVALSGICVYGINRFSQKENEPYAAQFVDKADGVTVYGHDQFIEVERTVKSEVWIVRIGYLLEVDSFYEVVCDNLSRGVKYKYFVIPDNKFQHELELLIDRFRKDERINIDPSKLITLEYLSSNEIPCTFIFLDPLLQEARGFVIVENDLRGPAHWVEVSKGQITSFVAAYNANKCPASKVDQRR